MEHLIQKYNIPGPRYTSYPTVPYWDKTGISIEDWKQTAKRSFNESNKEEGISLYIHLPFCESLCTFCGCHKRITKRHTVEEPYINSVLKEWKLYLDLFEEVPRIKEIHLGGGTPTFFSSENLRTLIEGILSTSEVTENHLFSYEGHPNNTTKDQVETLYDLGFRRTSFGVQGYDEKVQKTINRIQPFEVVKEVTELSREVGFTSISHDLVFGLPHQTLESIESTIRKTASLRPDRIAFYSYAHVPWIKGNGQRGYDEKDLPTPEEKRALYERGKELLHEAGYIEIGMDHFALEDDSLYQAVVNKTLHRNFMGYTSGTTQLMVGLGMSSISDSWYSFAQNVKTVDEYQELVNKGEFPLLRGHLLNEEDLVIRRHILNLMCHMETSWENTTLQFPEIEEVKTRMTEFEKDNLLEILPNSIKVYEQARPFIRNICMAFDLRLLRNKPTTQMFSMTI